MPPSMPTASRTAQPGSCRWLQFGHQVRQPGGLDVVQPEFLETGRVDQRGRALRIDPVPGRAGGGVLAAVERARDLAGLGLRCRHDAVDQRALASARRAQHQRGPALQPGFEFVDAGLRAGLQRQRQHRLAHGAVGCQALPGALEQRPQVALVEHDQCGYRFGSRRDQRPGELALGELGFGRQQDQHQVEVGGEGLGADFVLAVQQVAPFLQLLDRALVGAGLPPDEVADHGLALLAARMADQARAVIGLDQAVAAVGGDDESAA